MRRRKATTLSPPRERSTTGEGQTANKDNASGETPEQSKDTVGHPDERRATGEAQSGKSLARRRQETQ